MARHNSLTSGIMQDVSDDQLNSSITRNYITKLDDFLNDLAEELVPSPKFIVHANEVMDRIFRYLKVTVFYHCNLTLAVLQCVYLSRSGCQPVAHLGVGESGPYQGRIQDSPRRGMWGLGPVDPQETSTWNFAIITNRDTVGLRQFPMIVYPLPSIALV